MADGRLEMGFSDKNWVGIGLNWVRFHFLKKAKMGNSPMFIRRFIFSNWVRLVVFVFFQRDGR